MSRASFESFRRQVLRRCASDEVSLRLAEIGQFAQLRRGAELPLKNDIDQLVFLAQGATKLAGSMPDQSEHVLAFHFAGDMIYVPQPAKNRLHLLALTDCCAVAFPAERFLEVAEQDPSILRTILTRSLLALQRSRNKAIRQGRKSAQERLADFLLAMAERIGIPQNGAIRLVLPMSRRDIGNSLGLTIETVSRQLTELRDDKVISTSGRSIVTLCDLDELSIRAGHSIRTDEQSEICAGSKNGQRAVAIAAGD